VHLLFQAYDGALVRFKGAAAATNFSVALYQHQLAEHHQMKLVSTAQGQPGAGLWGSNLLIMTAV
jgi:hypothetical protein